MISKNQLTSYIIEPVLSKFMLYTKEFESLLAFTAFFESNAGEIICQPKTKKLGLYGMSAELHQQVWQEFIHSQPSYLMQFGAHLGITSFHEPMRLVYDMQYATALMAMRYLSLAKPKMLPKDEQGFMGLYLKHLDKKSLPKDKTITSYRNWP